MKQTRGLGRLTNVVPLAALAVASCAASACGGDPAGSQTIPEDSAIWYSDWSAGDLQDGGKWTGHLCQPSGTLVVVPGSEAGWTHTPNVLRVNNLNHLRSCGQLTRRLPLEDGRDFVISMWIRVQNEREPNFHPVATNPLGDIQLPLWAILGGPSPVPGVSYPAKFGTLKGVPARDGRWYVTLDQQRWYRFEWRHQWVDFATGTARIWPSIFDENGTLVADASQHLPIDGGPGHPNLAAAYAAGVVHTYTRRADYNLLGVGYEGTGNAQGGGHWYYADVRVSH
jgi:hypothetical protein